MARKLTPEEQEIFIALAQSELSHPPSAFTEFPGGLNQKTRAPLKLSPELGTWFGEDTSDLPLP
jgi:hypothetical protein